MLKKMRQCRLNFADNRYDCEAGIIGEHYATELIVTPPAIMPTEAVYRLCFEPGGLSEIILQTTDGAFSYPLPSAVTATPCCCVTLIGYVGSEQIYKSRMVRLHFSQTADGDADIDSQQPGIIAEVNRNTAARHSHENKAVLDKFAESDGKPTYDGEALGGGGGSVDSVNGKTGAVVLTAEDINYDNDNTVYELMSQWFEDLETVGDALTTLDEKSHSHDNKDTLDKLSASNGKLQYNGSDVGLKGDKGADGKDGTNGITPTIGANGNWYLGTTDTGKPSRGEKGDKGDPGSDANVTKDNVVAALGYTPEAVSAQVTTGTNITLADNTEYRLADVTALTLNYPTSDFECWMRLTFAASGDITVTLPAGTGYIGTAPDFKNSEIWELSFKDKILAAQKVGDGT